LGDPKKQRGKGDMEILPMGQAHCIRLVEVEAEVIVEVEVKVEV
jgi:hypothetical protein